MKKLLLFPISFLCYISFGQNNESDTSISDFCGKHIISAVPPEVAKARLDFFQKIKKNKITRVTENGNADDFTFTKKDVTDFLSKLAIHPEYDGVRIYFAVSNSAGPATYTPKKLYLILVPTIDSHYMDEDDDMHSDISNEDEKNAYIISDHSFAQVDLTDNKNHYVTKWMNKYVNKVVPRIETWFEKKYNKQLSETHSLWYSKEVLFSDSNRTDLLDQLGDCSGITTVNIDFACWTGEPDYLSFSFKNDLIFEEIGSGNKKSRFLTLSSVEIMKQEFYKKKNASAYTDTGNPCPPNKCP